MVQKVFEIIETILLRGTSRCSNFVFLRVIGSPKKSTKPSLSEGKQVQKRRDCMLLHKNMFIRLQFLT